MESSVRLLSKNSKLKIIFCCTIIFAYLAVFIYLPHAIALTTTVESTVPSKVIINGKEISLESLKNPIPESNNSLLEGSKVYIKNCALCHGDLLNGKGLYSEAFYPRPANLLHPKSILNKSKSYVFWRIMKGGPSLPKYLNPWDSAMPAWEGILKERDVWNVIQYIYSVAKERMQMKILPISEPSAEKGKTIYAGKCAVCHGNKGDGNGPGAKISSPFPRNFIKGHIKFRSTPFGKIPTDKDLFNAISNGSPGTTMPSWKHLSESDRKSLVLYLKTLSRKFKRFVAKGKSHKVIHIPDPPEFTLESLKRGKDLYIQNCSACHGVKGRGDGASTKKIVNLATDAIWPRNLSKPWKFRRGDRRQDVFLTLRTGLSLSAMPMFSPRIFDDEKIWDLVHYVQTLSPSKKPEIPVILKVKKIDQALPIDPNNPLWATIGANFYPLGGQIIKSKKVSFPIIDYVVVKALHNDNEIAFYLHWDDPTVDPILKKFITVKESPAPPLPAHLQLNESELDEPIEDHRPQEFSDSIAIQFPVSINDSDEKPYFLNGDINRPVNLWKWDSYPMKAIEMNATGIDTIKTQEITSQSLTSKANFKYGRYSLVIKRKLITTDTQNDIQFKLGKKIPIAFNAWNGSAGEAGSQKVISSWFNLVLE